MWIYAFPFSCNSEIFFCVYFFNRVNQFHLLNSGPRQKSHPYNLCPSCITLSEVTKLRAATSQLCLSSHESSDAFAGATFLRQIKVTCLESELWSSTCDNITKSFRQSLVFPGPLSPQALRRWPGFRVTPLWHLPYAGVGEMRLGDFCVHCAVQVCCPAWLVFLSVPPLQFYLKFTPSLARKCCPECRWGLWTSITCLALWQKPAFSHVTFACWKMRVALIPLQMSSFHVVCRTVSHWLSQKQWEMLQVSNINSTCRIMHGWHVEHG